MSRICKSIETEIRWVVPGGRGADNWDVCGFFSGDGYILELNSGNRCTKATDLSTLKGWTLWYVNSIWIKLSLKIKTFPC